MGLSFHAVRERLVLLVALVVAVVGPMLSFSLAAEAALPGHTATGEFTAFQIDGDRDGAEDWAGLPYGPYTTEQGRPSTGIIDHQQVADACQADPDDGYTGSIAGEPFPWPTTDDAKPNDKADLCELGVAYEVVDVDGVDHYVMYAFVSRVPTATGDTSTVLVLDMPGTQVGDTLVEFDFDPASGSTFPVRTWDGSQWVLSSVTAGVDPVQRGTNSTAGNEGTFVEVALDLTALDLFPPIDPDSGAQQCGTFVVAGAASFTGNDANSRLKDRIGSDFTITNCGSIEVVKAGAPAGAGPFGFDADFADPTAAPDGSEDFSLSIGDAAHVAADLPVGDYTIVELLDAANAGLDPDFVLDDVSCATTTVGSGTSSWDTDVTDGVNVSLGTADTVTCTFTNTQLSRLVVAKDGQPAGSSQDFDFDWDVADGDLDGTADFQLQIDGAPQASGDIAPGTYTVTELLDAANLAADPDFTLGGIACDITTVGSEGSTWTTSVADAEATVTLAAGDVVTCTFTNVQAGRIIVEKATVGADGTFTFSGAVSGDITTTGGTTAEGDALVADVAPGTHAVTETIPAGWDLTGATCDDESGSLAIDGTAGVLSGIDVAAGEVVTCTFTNAAQPGSLTVTKQVEGVADELAWSFDIAIAPVTDGITSPQAVSGVGNTSDAVTFGPLEVGQVYTVSEVDPGSSWTAGAPTCEVVHADGTSETVDPAAGFEVQPGDAVTCAITNTAKGEIVVVKNVEGADGTFAFTGDWTDGTPPLVDGGFEVTTTGGSGVAAFADVTPGSYTVSELAPDGYVAEGLSCTDSDEGGTASSMEGLAGMVELDPGETVTCVFGNTETATVVVDKVTTPSGDPTVFDFQFGPLGGDATDFGLADADMSRSFGGLAPGDYLLAELARDGWVLQDVSCDSDAAFVDGAEATITVAAGDVVTCTYTNARRGPVTVDKTVTAGPVDNGDGTWDVTYEITVTSESYVQEGYDLHDELRFGDGIEVISATASSDDAAVNPAWDGVTDPAMTDLTQGIDPLDVHTYTVATTSTVAPTASSTARDCELAAGEGGTGFLNGVTLMLVEGDDSSASACVAAPSEADLSIAKTGTAAVTLPAEGGTAAVTYTLEVVNDGPSPAADVVVTDALPAQLVLDEVTTSVGTCTATADGFECALGTMAAGATATIEVTTTTVADIGPGDLTNVGSVASSTPDPDPADNSDDHVTTIARALPHTGVDLPWLGLLAVLLVMVGVATREVGRSQRAD